MRTFPDTRSLLRTAPQVEPLPARGTVRPAASVQVDGKFFACAGSRFDFRGVTYGTFLPRAADGALFPAPPRVADDIAAMAAAGFTVVRTYTPPPADLLDAARHAGMKVLAGVYFPDWRDLVGSSGRQQRRVLAEARLTAETEARRLRGHDTVLALCLGNEIPADVLRWVGAGTVADGIAELAEAARSIDPNRLVTYANYPTAEYLPLDTLDFLTFNVFLENKDDLRRYLARLHNLAGERPLVLGEIGLAVESGGDDVQAEVLAWQLETALERGVAGTCVYSWTDEWAVAGRSIDDWHFGLTNLDRRPRPALDVARNWNGRTVADLDVKWPSISVVVCAFNAASTLDECLRHACALDYPSLEIIVVDDGSTDETAAIAERHPRARLVRIAHSGLATARNAGTDAATGEIVAYLDADAYPAPEWAHYLALAFDSSRVGGVGGPNVPPPDDPIGAHRVARAPGGPVHVLLSDDRAEHVPGCNMAFWRDVLIDVGGFDPIYTAAGDDVDLCWKVLDRGWEIGFHPAALVWHHRRPGLRAYLRQQHGYGRSEALVEARHPDRFSPAGTARWRGRIYNPLVSPFTARQRIYRGVYGASAFQSVYQAPAYGLDLAHQVFVPIATPTLLTAPLALMNPLLALPAALSALFLVVLFVLDMARTSAPRTLSSGTLRFRASVSMHHLLQPIVRAWGRARTRPAARHDAHPPTLPGPATRHGRTTLTLPADRPREELVAHLVDHLRAAGLRVPTATGWEAYDAAVLGSGLVAGEVLTSAYPMGSMQVRIRRRLRWMRLAVALALCVGVLSAHDALALAGVGWIVFSAARGVYRTGPLVRRTIIEAAR